jgi:hypothetical protein
VLEAPQRIEWVALDLVEHYRKTILPNGFKAMIVTSSREAALTYKQKLDQIPGAPESAVVISGDHNDRLEMQKWTNPADHKKAIEDFKKPISEHPLSILIVKDMLLTGFDAPIAQVMYLDRKLTDHTLLQAIARVNRTKANKFSGYIVDYFGLTDYLADALKVFSSTDVQGALKDLKDEILHSRVDITKLIYMNHPGAANKDVRVLKTAAVQLVEDMAVKVSSGLLFGGISSGRVAPLPQVADRVLSGGLSGVVFSSEVDLRMRVTQGCSPLAGEHVISGCSSNLIRTLDGRPALDVLLADLGVDEAVRATRDGAALMRALPAERVPV